MSAFSQLVDAAARDRIFPARREVPLALRNLVDYLASGKPIDLTEQLALATLLVGKLNRARGRPALSPEDHERRSGLAADGRKMFQDLCAEGVPYHDALSDAANWARDQPRNTEGRKAASLRKDIQCAR